ncbi:MAG: response regulator [Ignavibacteria bacterium]|nr:response regulator [Ignavibacteria bacterium]MBT8382720.1 response regulator [Ignavibacteria bacterium]MBT8390990.1 response regulator [Ignavibacteria bacterium]NNJ54398.1 response regulator [Ignavibacteriaceae bacterium]NNL22585.1 response regulator [Ignavibacteriaceae bacterium]
MQSAKIDFISKYNNLVQFALSSSQDFPNNLCEFIAEEYEFEAAVLVKIKENSFEFLGKSDNAKKSYNRNSQLGCSGCNAVNFYSTETKFDVNPNCGFQASDVILKEGCLHISVTDKERVLLKIAKKKDFTKSEWDNILVVGEAIRNLLRLWMGKKGSLSSSVSEIVSSIGPELRTPTNSIMGFASLLGEEKLSGSQSEYLTTLKENAYDLLALLNDLIDLAKLESDKDISAFSNVNLKQFVQEIVHLIEEKIENNRIEVLTSIDDNLPESVNLNAQKVRYILLNLLTNSLRLTERGKITVSVSSSEKNHLQIRISDTGVGISSDNIKDIFNPFGVSEFYTSNNGSTTGLGLTLVKRYVDFLNGEIEVNSSVGKGTTFNLTVPVEEITEIEKQISELPKPDENNKVLVIEDDFATSKLLANYLNKWGYDPTIVNSAEQTLKIVDDEQYLAILMDIVLPDTSGLELLQKLREKKNTKRTPIIICSVEAEQQKAFLMGAVEYFLKPINYKYLVEVLTHYKLRKDSNILVVDDDVPTLNLMKEAVEQAGFKPVAQSDSTKVMDVINNIDLDLAIIDLDMPEVSGVDLIEFIKSNDQFRNLPIIIYTGKESYEADIKRVDGLFDNLLHKSSTNIEDLQNSITEMINRYEEPSTPEEIKGKKGTTKILLVEDYKHSQIIVTRLLKKNDFDSIVVVENGQEALDAAQQQHYDLILMDMQMPVMNGFEATQRIRELPDYKEAPIIALTAFAMKGDREKCLDAGATDYIPKPIDSSEFIQKVKYYTENKVPVKQ